MRPIFGLGVVVPLNAVRAVTGAVKEVAETNPFVAAATICLACVTAGVVVFVLGMVAFAALVANIVAIKAVANRTVTNIGARVPR
jgi:hypothetical protein